MVETSAPHERREYYTFWQRSKVTALLGVAAILGACGAVSDSEAHCSSEMLLTIPAVAPHQESPQQKAESIISASEAVPFKVLKHVRDALYSEDGLEARVVFDQRITVEDKDCGSFVQVINPMIFTWGDGKDQLQVIVAMSSNGIQFIGGSPVPQDEGGRFEAQSVIVFAGTRLYGGQEVAILTSPSYPSTDLQISQLIPGRPSEH